MIQPEELRKHNLIHEVFHSTTGDIRKIFVVDCMHRNTVENAQGQTLGYFNCEAIKLSEEWIEKMPAFKKHWLNNNNHLEGHYYCLKLNKNKYCDLALMSGDKNGFFEVCLFPYNEHFRWQYVHEVQNIYWDLVKKPLEIKL